MHIPDGYLSPQTYIPLYGIFVATSAIAIKKIKKKMESKTIPYLGMAAAFSFLIMMFNIPIPGGTSGHAVGGAIISLLFGPWIGFMAVSVALIIQAFVFGDGGLTALGANCVNIAFFMPFVSWYLFKGLTLILGKNRSIKIAAFTAGYLSLCVSAIITAFELGIQPLIAQTSSGVPLYSPFPLKIAIPALAVEHFLLFGIVEGILTLLIFNYFYKNNPEMIEVLK